MINKVEFVEHANKVRDNTLALAAICLVPCIEAAGSSAEKTLSELSLALFVTAISVHATALFVEK